MSKFKEDKIAGGLAAGMTLNDIAEKHGVSIDMLVAEFKKGIGVEMEHTTDREVAKEIALDHLFEDPKYYTKLIDMEKGMNESAMGELDIMAKQSSNFKDFVKTFQKEFPLIQIDREAIKWLEGIYNDRTNESVNELMLPKDVDSKMKELGINKIPISSQGEKVLNGMVKEKFLDKVTNKERLIYFVESLGKEKFGYGVKGKPLSPLVDRFWNDITSEGIYFAGKMVAYQVAMHMKDMKRNGEELDSPYEMVKEYFKNFGIDYNRSRVFDSAIRNLEDWMKRNKMQESVNEESSDETLQGLKEMAMGDLERIADYANMILDRMKQGQELDSWMYSQITLSVDQLNSVHDTMDGKDGIKESELKGYLAADVVDDIVKTIGSKFVSGQIKNTPNRNYIYLKLTDIKFGSGVVKMLKSQFGIDAKVDYFGGKDKIGSIPSVVFPSNKVISEVDIEDTHDCGCGCGGVTEGGCGTAKLESKDGLERVAAGLPQTEEEPLNEWKAEEVLQQLGGRKFIAMTGAKNFVKNDPKKQIVFKIGGGAKNGINYVRVTLTSMDLYNMEFLKARGTELKVVASEKGVYNDQLQQMFTKHTGMNTKL
jgi:hypothetical protein